MGGGWERGRAGWKAAVLPDPAMGTPKPRPSWAARPGFTPVRGRRETRIPEVTARRVRRPGLRQDSPAGEEMKQRVLLLLIARRHGPAGSAARRSRSWDARGLKLRWPRCPPQAAADGPMRAGGPAARLTPRRRGSPVSGLCGAFRPLVRAWRAAVTWRRPGRDVTGRGAAEVWARIPYAYWTAGGCGRGSRATRGGVRPPRLSGLLWADQDCKWMTCKPV